MSLLAQINAPHFCAGIILDRDRVTRVPPILNYMWGWHRDYVRNYCDRKGWKIKIVNEDIGATEVSEADLADRTPKVAPTDGK